MEESSNIHISGRRIWNEKVGRKRDSSEIKKKKKRELESSLNFQIKKRHVSHSRA